MHSTFKIEPVNRPAAEERLAAALIAAFFLVHFVLLTARAPLMSGFQAPIMEGSLKRAVVMVAGGLLCYGLYRLLRLVHGRPVVHRVLVACVLCVPAALVLQTINDFLHLWLSGVGFQLELFLTGSLYWLWFLCAWAGVYLACSYSLDVRDHERRLAAAQALAHDAQLRALRYQVNPHFLFNTLSSVASLIHDGRRDVAEEMVLTLSDYFRTSLTKDPLEDSKLSEEFALQRTYLQVEQMRFQNRLTVHLELPHELRNARIPSLLLQPLVENAIKHAVAPSPEQTQLSVVARQQGHCLRITVANNVHGPDRDRHGTRTGLQNVQERLRTRYGSNATFELCSSSQRFAVILMLPLEWIGA